jgi:Arc/MetJ family transcription regulator
VNVTAGAGLGQAVDIPTRKSRQLWGSPLLVLLLLLPPSMCPTEMRTRKNWVEVAAELVAEAAAAIQVMTRIMVVELAVKAFTRIQNIATRQLPRLELLLP